MSILSNQEKDSSYGGQYRIHSCQRVKALGNQLHSKNQNIELIEALPYDDDEKSVEEIEVNDQEELSADDDHKSNWITIVWVSTLSYIDKFHPNEKAMAK